MQSTGLRPKDSPLAIFSRCRRYRYTLRRVWNEQAGFVNFVMLNPSKADEFRDDPTVQRCINFAIDWGYGGLIVTNIFASRSTDPRRLKMLANPSGPENNLHILASASEAKRVICAWGVRGTLLNRDKEVLELLKSTITPYCLGRTKDGHPKHPLFVPGDVVPGVLL